jgi:hypothetical protein
MSALFETYANKLANDAETAHVGDMDQDALRYVSFSKGLVDRFYYDAFTSTERQLGGEAQKWADAMTDSREALVRTAVGLAAGPEVASDMAAERGQGIAEAILESWIRQTVSASPDQAPKSVVEGIKGLQQAELSTSWPATLATHAAALLSAESVIADIHPATVQFPGQATARTFSGDPYGRGHGQNKYISGPDTDFVATMRRYGGPEALVRMSPAQLGAYSRWLQDPAVVKRLAGRGAFDSVVSRNLPDDAAS